jgi:hypothetical protein
MEQNIICLGYHVGRLLTAMIRLKQASHRVNIQVCWVCIRNVSHEETLQKKEIK